MERPEVNLDVFLTFMAWVLASLALAFVLYLGWRKFGPHRRHRRHHSRMRHLAGKE